MAYDPKFREVVLGHVDKGHTIRETAQTFNVDPKTILNWRKLRKETGQLQDAPKERRHKKIDPVKLAAYFEKNPDSYLSEAAEAFNCSMTAIFKARKRLKITRKKN
jgi:transposase-like protein